ncbi:type VI secretion protein [Salmonella enterica subsp. enterica serovar Sanjuan]|uniref:Type VI secretion protein n=1 Tax=Salmonella enterica subsp. enterica serovar Sanjuan TaxID=1160765 RepID=A0A3S4G0V0_SALET|nr:type VI secretion protein [Salmonella enterica subsp. enterica serovar Sanjuan]
MSPLKAGSCAGWRLIPVSKPGWGERNPKNKTAGYVPGRSGDSASILLSGTHVPDRSGKFLLRIGNLSMSRYLSFFAAEEHHAALTMFIAFLLRDQFAWDLRLDLAPAQAQGMKLGDSRRACIGRTAFIGEPKMPPSVTLHIRD